MRACGWGRYPSIDAEISRPTTTSAAAALLNGKPVTPRGLARSYGDSALGPHVIDACGLDCMYEFDAESGRLRCGAGVSLGAILDLFLPRGWSLAARASTPRSKSGATSSICRRGGR
jgi:FAD/FMN-containing dehydrogenase